MEYNFDALEKELKAVKKQRPHTVTRNWRQPKGAEMIANLAACGSKKGHFSE